MFVFPMHFAIFFDMETGKDVMCKFQTRCSVGTWCTSLLISESTWPCFMYYPQPGFCLCSSLSQRICVVGNNSMIHNVFRSNRDLCCEMEDLTACLMENVSKQCVWMQVLIPNQSDVIEGTFWPLFSSLLCLSCLCWLVSFDAAGM